MDKAVEDISTSEGLEQVISTSEVKDWFREEHLSTREKEKNILSESEKLHYVIKLALSYIIIIKYKPVATQIH